MYLMMASGRYNVEDTTFEIEIPDSGPVVKRRDRWRKEKEIWYSIC